MKKLVAIGLSALLVLTAALPSVAMAEDEGEENIPVYTIEAEVQRAAGFTPDSPLPVKSAILIEQSTGRVLFERNSDELLPPASVTKIMSLLLFMEALDSGRMALEDKVTCSETAAAYGGSQIWLKPGEEMTVDELLRAAAIASANDATVCLAEHLAGSEQGFVEMMNLRAGELGMTNTTFKCAAGLDNEGHLTTARDIATMSRELMTHPKIKNYTTVWMDSLRDGATQLVNTNRLVRFYQGATGLKTGTTSGAGSCLSATAERDGLGLIAVVMGADTSDNRFAAARALLDWGFGTYMQAKLEPVDNLAPVKVTGGVEPTVKAVCAAPAGVIIERTKAKGIIQEAVMEQSIAAPVAEGAEIGKVRVMAEGELLLEYPVCAASAVEEMTLPRALGILWGSMMKCA